MSHDEPLDQLALAFHLDYQPELLQLPQAQSEGSMLPVQAPHQVVLNAERRRRWRGLSGNRDGPGSFGSSEPALGSWLRSEFQVDVIFLH